MRQIPRSKGNVRAARAARASCQSVQGRHAAAGALATPVMILIMENAALNAVRPFLDVGESAVGTAIDVRHLAATPVGHHVRAEAEVIKVDEGKVEFKGFGQRRDGRDRQRPSSESGDRSSLVQRASRRQEQALASAKIGP